MIKNLIKNDTARNIIEWLIVAIAALLLGLFIRTFVFKTASVFGESMEPTLSHNDILIINKLPYVISKPQKDDIIAFPYKSDTSRHYIKRIIGLPGDIIDMQSDGLYINGEKYNDDFSEGDIWSLGNIIYPITVPDDCYFVLGDNRNRSEDSRYSEVGFIPASSMDGKVSFRLYPLNKFGFIN